MGRWYIPRTTGRRYVPHQLTVAVIVIGLAVTGVLTGVSRVNYSNNEQRLTTLETQLTGQALGFAPLDLERRIGQAVSAAANASDPVAAFRAVIAPSMSPGGPFVAASLAVVRGGTVTVLARVGAKPLQNTSASTPLYLQAARNPSLVTTRVVAEGQQRFGYLMSAAGPDGATYVVGAGQELSKGNHVQLPASSPDAVLDFALYFGPTTAPLALVESNADQLPLGGTVSKVTEPFGNNVLTLVISPRGSLAGAWANFAPWAILGVGILFTFGIATMTERLVRRRELAETLAVENRRLFNEQRRVAATLQRSLLPRSLPAGEHVEVGVRYLPGTAGVDIGGDWYDVVEIGDRGLFFTVGDVAGRGLEAAALMSTLRNAINAYALDGDDPGTVLGKVTRLLDVARDERFATVLCGLLDVASGEVAFANAGHLAPLVVHDGTRAFVSTPAGLPIGVRVGTYESVRLSLDQGSTILAFTDGLVERRGEPISAGLERLRALADGDVPLERLLDGVVGGLVSDESPDDVAVLGLRWRGAAATRRR